MIFLLPLFNWQQAHHSTQIETSLYVLPFYLLLYGAFSTRFLFLLFILLSHSAVGILLLCWKNAQCCEEGEAHTLFVFNLIVYWSNYKFNTQALICNVEWTLVYAICASNAFIWIGFCVQKHWNRFNVPYAEPKSLSFCVVRRRNAIDYVVKPRKLQCFLINAEASIVV